MPPGFSNIGSQLINPQLSSKSGPLNVVAIGDSVTANGLNGGNSLSAGVVGKLTSKCWLMWASIFSAGKIMYGGSAGTPSVGVQTILDNHLATALATKPDVLILEGGTNDVLTNFPADANAFKAQIVRFISACNTAGVLPVVMTLTPRNEAGPGARSFMSKNECIRNAAAENGALCWDAWVEPTLNCFGTANDGGFTYGWNTGLYADAVHPNGAGAKAIGQALWNFLEAHGAYGTAKVFRSPTDCGAMLLTVNQQFTGGVNGTPGTVATNWNLDFGEPTQTFAAGTAGELGTVWKLARQGGADVGITSSNLSITSADKCLITCRFGATLAAAGTFDIRLVDLSGTIFCFALDGWDTAVPLGSVLSVYTRAPSTQSTYRFQFRANGSDTSAIYMAETAVIDLTAQGL